MIEIHYLRDQATIPLARAPWAHHPTLMQYSIRAFGFAGFAV